MNFPKNIIAGSIKAEIGGYDLKVKERLKGIWDGKGKLIRFNVVGFTIQRIPGYGTVTIKCMTETQPCTQ